MFSHYAEANPASYKSKISSSQLLIIDIQVSRELYCPDFSRIMSESPSFTDGEGSETTDLPAALEIESIATEEVQPTVLFPQRRTSLEKVTKTRKQYSEMIETALFQMNETRTGSSRQAILKYIRANYEVGDNASRYLSLAIAKLLEQGRIVRKSGVGGLGKFTLSKEIREAMRKGVKAKSKPKPKPTKPKAAAKGTKPAKDKGKEKGAESKAKTGKSKAKAKKADEGDEESDKENKPKAKKTTNKTGAKATGGQAKKEEPKAAKKTANEKKKAENAKGKGEDKAADKATKESKKTTGSKEKPKPKETKAGQSKAKGKAAAAKEKGNEKEAADDASKKPGQKNTRKNAEKTVKQKSKNYKEYV